VESASTPKCCAANRGDGVREPVCHDIGMDGRREYKRLLESESGCGPIRTCMFSVQSITAIASDL